LLLPAFDIEHKHVERSDPMLGKECVAGGYWHIDAADVLMRAGKGRVSCNARLIERLRTWRGAETTCEDVQRCIARVRQIRVPLRKGASGGIRFS